MTITYKNKVLCTVALAATTVPAVHAQDNATPLRTLIFTEVCVANVDQTIDHSNNYGSWAEVYNPTGRPVSLENWYISDDAANLKKHQLKGNGTVEAGSYKCLFFGHNALDGQYGADAGKQVRFKLDKDGGTLYLSADGARTEAVVNYPPPISFPLQLRTDRSQFRHLDALRAPHPGRRQCRALCTV